MTLLELVRRCFTRDYLSNWTPSKAEYYERLTLEREGIKGFHFTWYRAYLKAKERARANDIA